MARQRTAPRMGATVAAGALLVTALTVPAQADRLESMIEHPLDDGATPHSVTFSPAGSELEGTLWFTDDLDGSLYQADPAAPEDATRIHLADAAGPRGVAAADDVVWVAGAGNDTLYRVTPGEGEGDEASVEALDLHEVLGTTLPAQPSYIALSEDGETAWVTLTQANRILKVSTEGDLTVDSVLDVISVPGTLPTQIVVGGDDRVWFSHQGSTAPGLGIVDPETDEVTSVSIPSGGPKVGLAAAGDSILLTALTEPRIYTLDLDGTIRGRIDLPAQSLPRGIAVSLDNTGAPATAWVAMQGTAGVAPAAVAQIDLREWSLVGQVELGDPAAGFYNIAAKPASHEIWGTARAAGSLFSFSHSVVVTDRLEVTAGADEWIVSGDHFSSPMEVTATSAGGQPVEGAVVTFAVDGTESAWFVDGGVQSASVSAVTGADGVARATQTLESDLVSQNVDFQVVATTLGAPPAIFTRGIGVLTDSMVITSPSQMSTRVGSDFEASPTVRLTRDGGGPSVDTLVTFTISGDEAEFVVGPGQGERIWEVRTDVNGVATAPAVHAARKGAATITVSSRSYPGTSPQIDLSVHGVPASITVSEGDQLVPPGGRGIFEATVRDMDGDPVPDEPVEAVIDPSGLTWVKMPEGTDVLELMTDSQGTVSFGARGDGSDTFSVSTSAEINARFNVVLTTANPGAVSMHMLWQVGLGR